MDIYKTIHPLLLEKTPFVFIRTEYLEIYQDIKSDEPFATLECKGKQIIVTIHDFYDWSSLRIIMILGKYILSDEKNRYTIDSYIIVCECDMNEELIYDYEMNGRPWYVWDGYIPHFKTWTYSKTRDFYQLPFLKPRKFLELDHGKILIHPNQIILERKKESLLFTAQKDPNDLHLRLLPSTCFYSISKRPINSMVHLRQRSFQLLHLSKVPTEILKSGAPFRIGEDFYVPVVRYSNGMRNGCYFDSVNSDCKYLGTFYYWEPESGCYLKMGKKFDFFENKFECAVQMMYKLEQLDEVTGGENENISKLFRRLEKYTRQILDEMIISFKKNHEEYMNFEKMILRDDRTNDEIEELIQNDFVSVYLGVDTKYLPITKEYKSTVTYQYMKSLFYAMEDELDQVLAQALIFLGYDVVIFGRMAGMYRVVTEVMDVRSRDESLKNLCWRVD